MKDKRKVKNDRLSLRINSEDKKQIQKRAIEKGFGGNISEYFLYACMREIAESEIINNAMRND